MHTVFVRKCRRRCKRKASMSFVTFCGVFPQLAYLVRTRPLRTAKAW